MFLIHTDVIIINSSIGECACVWRACVQVLICEVCVYVCVCVLTDTTNHHKRKGKTELPPTATNTCSKRATSNYQEMIIQASPSPKIIAFIIQLTQCLKEMEGFLRCIHFAHTYVPTHKLLVMCRHKNLSVLQNCQYLTELHTSGHTKSNEGLRVTQY